MSHPDGLPELFLDRSLGRKVVPELLRAEGLRLVTLSEHYGIPDDEEVADEEWLEFAGTSDKAVLMKDTRIRYNRAEREAVKRHGVRCFCLTRQDLTGPEMAARFIANLEADIARGTWHDPTLGHTTIAEWADRWLATKLPTVRRAIPRPPTHRRHHRGIDRRSSTGADVEDGSLDADRRAAIPASGRWPRRHDRGSDRLDGPL